MQSKELKAFQIDTSEDHPFPKASTETTKDLPPPADQLTPEGKPIGVAPAAIPREGHRPQWINHGPPVHRIVEMISRYLYLDAPDDKFEATGREALKSVVSRFVDGGERIELVFPGFPFKSPGKDRVLGTLPDFAEELLLRRLEMLASSIEDYYSPGAIVRIVSDGVVYGEILQQSDSVVYKYNAELRSLVSELGLSHISFVRVSDLLKPTSGTSEDVMTEEEYVYSIPGVRAKFLAHPVHGFDVENALKTDTGVSNTFKGYLKFLEAAFPASKTDHEIIAKTMLKNGAIFSDIVASKFPNAVRISCHAHDNAGPKYAFDMFPGAARAASAWHNTVLQKADGTFVIKHLNSFDPSTYEVVKRKGCPYYLREHSHERDFGEKINPHVKFIPNIPFGLIIKVDPAVGLSFHDLPMDKVRALSIRHSVVLLQGFALLNEEDFVKKSHEMGEVIPWNSLGPVVKLKETPNFDMNSTLTCESMPMHYDGLFKAKTLPNGEITNDPPLFQMFQCLHAPGGGQGGRTMVTNGADVLNKGLNAAQREWLRGRRSISFTPKNQAFGGNLVNMPLIVHNDHTGHDVIRWLESWPQHVTKFNPIECIIDGVSPAVSDEVGEYLTDLLYDRRFCYAHPWTTGDILIAENVETLHNRTAFKPCPRELWRIHVN